MDPWTIPDAAWENLHELERPLRKDEKLGWVGKKDGGREALRRDVA